MSFLDRFKPKVPEKKAPEKKPEAKAEPKPQNPPGRKSDAPKPTTAAAAAPSGFSPDLKLQAPEKKAPEQAPPASAPQHEVTLELGDFLNRLPPQMLIAEKCDPATPVTFDIPELAERIARGQTMIPLVEIYRRVPAIFREQVLPSDGTEVRFPWQKVMKLLSAYKAAPGGGGGSAPGLSSAAAESLSEKLRTRRAVRNIIPGGAVPSAPSAEPPAAASPKPAASAPPIIKALEFNIPALSPEEDQRMTKEEILRDRDNLRNLISRAKGEFERQLAVSDQQRKILADEREKVLLGLARAKKEIDDRDEQVVFEKSVAVKSAENLSKAQQERDAFKQELSSLKAEMNKGLSGDQRLKEIVAERDTLAQRQAELSKQLAEFQKHAAGGAGAAAGAERSQKEYQRQIEELQRRINVMETGQRESAQELGREREAKIKIERQLSSADRLQQESAAKIEEATAGLRREHEAALRKRDAEGARTMNEVKEQVETLNAANLKLTSELEGARKTIAATRETAVGEAQQRQSALRSEHEAALAEREGLAARNLKEVQAEVETLSSANTKLTAELAETRRSLEAQAAKIQEAQAASSSKHEATLAERETLASRSLKEVQAKVEALTAANTKLTAELTEVRRHQEPVTARIQDAQSVVRQEFEAALAEHQDLAARNLKDVQAKVEALTAENGKLKTELSESQLRQADGQAQESQPALSGEQQASIAQRESFLKEAQARIEALTDEKTRLASELEDARKHVAATHQAAATKILETHAVLRSEHETVLADREAEYQARVESLDATNAQLATDLAKARKDLQSTQDTTAAKLGETHASLRSEHEAHVALRKKHETLLSQRETLADALGKREAQLDALTAGHAKLNGELEQMRKGMAAAQEAAAAKLRETSAALQSEHGATLSKQKNETTRALEEAQGQIKVLLEANSKLTNEASIARDNLAAIQASSSAWDARAGAQFEADSKAYRDRIKSLLQERDKMSGERDKLAANLAAHTEQLTGRNAALDQLKTGSEATIGGLRTEKQKIEAERDAAVKEREKASAELAKLKTDQQAQREQWERDLATARQGRELEAKALAEMRAGREVLSAEKAALVKEMAQARYAHESALTNAAAAAKAAQEKALAERQAERDALNAKLDALTQDLTALRTGRDELQARHNALAAELSNTQSAHGETTTHRDNLLAKIESLTTELAASKHEHAFAFAELDRDRSALRTTKDALAHEFASSQVAHEKALAELRAKHDAANTSASEIARQFSEAQRQTDELQAKLRKTEAALAEAQLGETTNRSRLKQQEEAMAKLVAEHRAALATTAGKHERILSTVQAEKDAAVSNLVLEKTKLVTDHDAKLAALNAEYEKTLAAVRKEKDQALEELSTQMNAVLSAVTTDRDKLREALLHAERKYPVEIAALTAANEEAQNISSTVAERLAAMSLEFDQKHAKLAEERDAILAEKQKLTAELEEARESHKAQGGVFAREFKGVVKQRDDALALLEAERNRLAEKMSALEKERAAIAAAEMESKARIERELARFRRERDSVVHQRDSMRERIEKLMDEQRQMLEEVNTQATFSAMKREPSSAPPPPPPAPVSQPAPAPKPTAAPPPEEPAPEAIPESKPREARGRESRRKESNVIDITEAEVTPRPEEEGRLKIQRVRPVVMPPPQVRVL